MTRVSIQLTDSEKIRKFRCLLYSLLHSRKNITPQKRQGKITTSTKYYNNNFLKHNRMQMKDNSRGEDKTLEQIGLYMYKDLQKLGQCESVILQVCL